MENTQDRFQPVYQRVELCREDAGSQSQLHSDGDLCETRTTKPIEHEVGRDIVMVAKMDLNMCMLSCIYNSITTERGRTGFRAGGDINGLVATFQERTQYSKVDREEDGYTANDMAVYLKWLKQHDHIVSYTWKKVCAETLLRKVFAQPEMIEQLPATYILFGWTLPTDERNCMIGRFKKLARELKDRRKVVREKELVRYYMNGLPKASLKKYKKLEYTHGVALRVETDRTVAIIDNKNKKWKQLKSMEEFGPNLLAFWACYLFEIKA